MLHLTTPRAKGRPVAILVLTMLPAFAAAGLAVAPPQPAFLWNGTPSEPEGLYVRTGATPAPGQIIAFRTPAGAFPYADGRMDYLRRIPILKAVAAGQGDRVCTRDGVLSINGAPRGAILARDARGARLPVWRGCRVLTRGEFFVFSDRIPNSFDSRYYGPVTQALILGVFQPLMVSDTGARGV